MKSKLGLCTFVAVACCFAAALAAEQDEPTESSKEKSNQSAPPIAKAQAPATQPAADAQAAMRQMKERLQTKPAGDIPRLIIKPTIDPRTVGPAPDAPRPKLRREGEFVIKRLGRIKRTPGSIQSLFIFDSAATKDADPPMVLVPCQYVQTMEDWVQERGDQILFQITGQILVYRGANYLLPTMMKIELDRGNLKR